MGLSAHVPDRLMTRSTKSRTRRYVLSNPHDEYEFDAPDDVAADAVASLLGGGWFGWLRGDESRVVGMLGEVEQAERVGAVRELIERSPKVVAAALRSVEIDPSGREVLKADAEDWHSKRRSSLTDLRASAFETADLLDPPEVSG